LKNVVRKDGIVFSSDPMKELVALADRLAPLPLPVIIRGEAGSGKEVLARYLHNHSPRADKPFVAVNCGAIPEYLIESLLFGHAKGSFTGAIDNRKGYFEEADGGTIFLDEINELPLNMQVKLLRVLQEKHITRMGDNREIPVNVRIISATHVDLEEAVREKKFREDLFFKIQVTPIQVPPLRERSQDVILLAEEFLKRYSAEYGRGKFKFSRNAEKAMLSYHWPGNVRELENKIQKSLVQAVHGVIQPGDLGLENIQKETKESPRTLKEAREAVERDVIGNALRDTSGNLTLAATILGIDRKVLREIMERLGIKKEDFK
jgi:transcriptional regulator with PAS, ATPase and Fis domain